MEDNFEKVVLTPQLLLGCCVLSVLCILLLASLWRIYKKTGKPGWSIFIPFYGGYVLHKKVWRSAAYLWEIFWIAALFLSVPIIVQAFGLSMADNVSFAEAIAGVLGLLISIYAAIAFVLFGMFIHYMRVCLHISKAFGHGNVFGFAMTLLPFILLPVLAFGKAQYIGPAVKKKKAADKVAESESIN